VGATEGVEEIRRPPAVDEFTSGVDGWMVFREDGDTFLVASGETLGDFFIEAHRILFHRPTVKGEQPVQRFEIGLHRAVDSIELSGGFGVGDQGDRGWKWYFLGRFGAFWQWSWEGVGELSGGFVFLGDRVGRRCLGGR